MKPVSIIAIFDSHTPYLAFRLNAFHDAIERRGLSDKLKLEIVLIGAEEASYGWDGESLQSQYHAPIHILSSRFRGLGMRSFFHPSVPRCLWKWFRLLIKKRPKIVFAGGYDRPESMLATFLCRLWRGKTGVWNDSKFDDAESYGKRIGLEWIKSLMVARYAFYLCPGRASVDYHRFLGGRKKLALTESWDIVDNATIGQLAEVDSNDGAIAEALEVSLDQPYFLMPVRFVAKKNIAGVIRAYDDYQRHYQNGEILPLVICGKGELEQDIREEVARRQLESKIRIVPWLRYEQVPRACRRARAVILASFHDQWGMIVNEALAAGAPVLVSNRCGAQELVRNHINGFTFDPYALDHLTELFAVMTRDENLVTDMKKSAASSIHHFSIETWLKNHFTVLEHFGVLPQTVSNLAQSRVAP